MNNKGLTLVELLAVVVILSLLALFVIPKVLEVKESKEKEISSAQKQILFLDAAEYFKEKQPNQIVPGEELCVNVSTLIDEGYDSMRAEDLKDKSISIVVDENSNFVSSIDDNKCFEPEIGDYVRMTPNPGTLDSQNRYPTDTSKTGYNSVQYIYPKQLNLWRVIKKNDDGTIDMVSEYVSSIGVYFSGATGYANFVGYLNVLANQYQNSKYTIRARAMGYNGQTEYITDTSYFDGTSMKAATEWTSSTTNTVNQMPTNESLGGGDTMYQKDVDLVNNAIGQLWAYKCNNDTICSNPSTTKTTYWLASRLYFYSANNYFIYAGRKYYSYYDSNFLTSDNILGYFTDHWGNNSNNNAIRPIVTLKKGIKASSGEGTQASPYILN